MRQQALLAFGLFSFFIPALSYATCQPGEPGCIRCLGPEGPGALIRSTNRQAGAFLGLTPEEIQQRFFKVQEINFGRGNTQKIVSNLSDRELTTIATLYSQSASTGGNRLLRIFAQRLDGSALSRISNAFGPDATARAVRLYSSPDVQAVFSGNLQRGYPKGKQEVTAPLGGAPNLDMTLNEIYLDFRTAPVGALSPAAALAETTVYAGGWLAGAWGAGYEFGSGIHSLIETYAPSFDDVLGGTIDQAIQNIDTAANEFQQGKFENAADSLFEYPIFDTGDFGGDWDVGASYDYYEGGSGGC